MRSSRPTPRSLPNFPPRLVVLASLVRAMFFSSCTTLDNEASEHSVPHLRVRGSPHESLEESGISREFRLSVQRVTSSLTLGDDLLPDSGDDRNWSLPRASADNNSSTVANVLECMNIFGVLDHLSERGNVYCSGAQPPGEGNPWPSRNSLSVYPTDSAPSFQRKGKLRLEL